MRRKHWRRLVVSAEVGACVVVLLAAVQFVALVRRVSSSPPAQEPSGLAGVPAVLSRTAPQPRERTVDPYAGYGTWVDVYDFLPPTDDRGAAPLGIDAIDDMASSGIQTLYLQAAQFDGRWPGLLADRSLLAQFLVRAQRAGIKVIGWYLPKFIDIDRDLAHLQAIADFEVLGHRFDGLAVDIEWTDSISDPSERSSRLIELSERLRTGLGSEPLGAIVLPPVQIEVVNPDKWPGFPWRQLDRYYDVWLPMGYWTERRADSEYRDGATYTEENVRRLRDDLDDPEALVHAIGGIGDEVDATHAERFARTVDEVDAIGGSIYDWQTLDRRLHGPLAARISSERGH